VAKVAEQTRDNVCKIARAFEAENKFRAQGRSRMQDYSTQGGGLETNAGRWDQCGSVPPNPHCVAELLSFAWGRELSSSASTLTSQELIRRTLQTNLAFSA
jgi:hypothetical protein